MRFKAKLLEAKKKGTAPKQEKRMAIAGGDSDSFAEAESNLDEYDDEYDSDDDVASQDNDRRGRGNKGGRGGRMRMTDGRSQEDEAHYMVEQEPGGLNFDLDDDDFPANNGRKRAQMRPSAQQHLKKREM